MLKKLSLMPLLALIFLGCTVNIKPYLLDMQNRYTHEDFIQDEAFLTKHEHQMMYSKMNMMLRNYRLIQKNIESSQFTKDELAQIDYQKASITLNKFKNLYTNTFKDTQRALQSAKTALFFSQSIAKDKQKHSNTNKQILSNANQSSKLSTNIKNMVVVKEKYKKAYKNLVKATNLQQQLREIIESTTLTKKQSRDIPYQKAYDITYLASKTFIIMGDIPRALESALNALFYAKIIAKQKENKQTINAYNQIATVYNTIENYSKALEYVETSISVSTNTLGNKSLLLASAYAIQSSIHRSMNLYPKAIKSVKEAISITETSIDEPSELKTYYKELSELHKLNKNQTEAKAISNKMSTNLLTSIQKDAQKYAKYTKQGKHKEALKHLKKVVIQAENDFGKEHYIPAFYYGKMSLNYLKLNQDTKALSYATRALRINKKVFGNQHFNTIKSYSLLSLVYLKMDNIKKAYSSTKISIELLLNSRKALFANLNKQEKLANERFNIESFLYVALLYKKKHYGKRESISKEVFNIWLRYKEEITNSEAYLTALKSKTKSSEVKFKIDELIKTKKAYSSLFLKKLSNKDAFTESTQLSKLKETKDNLESYLSSQVEEYKQSLQLKDIHYKQISQRLKKDEVYLDFAHIRKTDSYAVFTLNHSNKVNFHIMNPKKNSLESFMESPLASLSGQNKPNYDKSSIDTLVKLFRDKIFYETVIHKMKLSDKDKYPIRLKNLGEIAQIGYKLFDTLILNVFFEANLELSDYKKLIISPDGILNLLPFEALSEDEDNDYKYDPKWLGKERFDYLIKKRDITYVSSGKAFLKAHQEQNKRSKSEDIVVLSYLDYDKYQPSRNIPKTEYSEKLKSIFHRGTAVNKLTDTKDEAKYIKSVFGEERVSSYSGYSGTKGLLYSLDSPKILHLSTHSFYEDDSEKVDSLLKSAMALSGYNEELKEGSFQNRGLMSALEFSTLNLYNTELVLFSSCESGLGDRHSAEGVSGLNKGAKLAGAKRVISTLWSVDSKGSLELTNRFYKYLKEDKLGYAHALKTAKLFMINQEPAYQSPNKDITTKEYEMTKIRHPFYWAGFVENGIN
ncbi:MAG: diguanylate cyclase/phosphodiesterase (GGDEF & EAL domains) with PAS/PAC sensor(s) [uncultured Sulfurovum sp.]|uniref:Diguanylate cyclase/phosphodiesterase (GGDEF & EAL domains) with PAS/PAC sensor(S) n=1 Tax=uncultured Sulfurovum sp. TaxID=269237 RepID=A0A6S6SBA3_9BACT|nr:MAG: diguanylate cyclase/phosphodiesterase (GGDEF & EAL domains) with PAS/PAC sensor(s) [uncultured Sulfurovum sp.]